MKAQKNTLSFENLEDRAVPAGDVLAFVDADGDLEIRGDDLANQITIVQLDADSYRVSGANGTAIHEGSWANPGFSSVVIDGVDDDIVAFLGDGDDRVTLGQYGGITTEADDIWVYLEGGNDIVTVTNVWAHDDLRLYGGDDADAASVSYSTVGFSGVQNGDNDLEIDQFDRRFGSSVNVFGVSVDDDLMIDSSDADSDRVSIYVTNSNIGDHLIIDTGNTQDTIRLTNVFVGEDVDIETRGGNDYVTFDGVDVDDEIDMNLGSGNDTVTFIDTTADDVDLFGGTGFDTLNVDNESNFGDLDEDFEG